MLCQSYLGNKYRIRNHAERIPSQAAVLTCHPWGNICVDYSHFLLRDLKGQGIDFTGPCQVSARISSTLQSCWWGQPLLILRLAAKHPHLQMELKKPENLINKAGVHLERTPALRGGFPLEHFTKVISWQDTRLIHFPPKQNWVKIFKSY